MSNIGKIWIFNSSEQRPSTMNSLEIKIEGQCQQWIKVQGHCFERNPIFKELTQIMDML